ncbi:MAG: nuclear transport factor 2 family protein [Candidatus Zixiibacteriota bacterium]|nr:MAG: nuclear transport factor 2 family protein [candidate division Zixibacteria bacterium]
MKGFRTATASIVICLVLLTAASVIAEEWSKEQKEVFAAVEAYSEMVMKRDVEGFLKYVHKDYCGWDYDTPVPYGFESLKKWVSFGFPRSEILIYEITPLKVLVFGESAIIHYYFYYRVKDYEGKEKSSTARWTDILARKDGKWLLIADHGGTKE